MTAVADAIFASAGFPSLSGGRHHDDPPSQIVADAIFASAGFPPREGVNADVHASLQHLNLLPTDNPGADVLRLARDVGMQGFERTLEQQATYNGVVAILAEAGVIRGSQDDPASEVVALARGVSAEGWAEQADNEAIVASLIGFGVVTRASGNSLRPGPKAVTAAQPVAQAGAKLRTAAQPVAAPAQAAPAVRAAATPATPVRGRPVGFERFYEHIQITIGSPEARVAFEAFQAQHGLIACGPDHASYWLARVDGSTEVRVLGVFGLGIEAEAIRSLAGTKLCGRHDLGLSVSTEPPMGFSPAGPGADRCKARGSALPPQIQLASFDALKKAAGR